MRVNNRHTKPQICPKKPKPSDMGKEWFINVRFYNPEKNTWIPRHFKGDLNRIEKFSERLYEAKVMLDKITKDLKEGYHPFIKKPDPVPEVIELTLSTGLDFALNNSDISKNTHKNYRLTIKYIKEAATTLKLDNHPIKTFTRKQVKLVLQECRRSRNWSDCSFNKYLGFLKAMLSVLVEWEEIEYNPAHKIKSIKVEETQKFVPYTAEEKRAIRDYLFLYNYKFFIFVMCVYHTGMRPMEVLALKLKDLRLEARLIRILPEKKRDNSKTKKIREVPINNHLHLLLKQHIEGCTNPEWFLFGSPFLSGLGNRGGGKGTKHEDYFNPSVTRIKRDTVTRLWKKVIVDTLGIQKFLYAAKHTGADDKIMAGIDVQALQRMYGHASSQMTEKYITTLKGLHQKQIIDLSPDF